MKRQLAGLIALIATVAVAAPAWAADCTTPRVAWQTFIDNLQPDTNLPEKAATCFDWSSFEGTAGDRHQVVKQFKSVLDAKGHYVYYDQIPNKADYEDPETGKSEHSLFPGALPEVMVRKTGDRWLFTADTVRAVPALHEGTFVIDVKSLVLRLPEPLRSGGLGRVKYWQLLGLLVLLFFALLLGKIITKLSVAGVGRVLGARKVDVGAMALGPRTQGPLSLAVACGITAPALPLLELPVQLSATLVIALEVAAIGSIVVILYRVVDIATNYFGKQAEKTETRLDDQLVPLVRKALKISLVIVAFIFVLQNLNVDVGSLLAGLGLGGLAFALAAKDTLSHFFGSLTIFMDRPFQLGDWVKIGDVEGTVEEVGFRSTRVRTFYSSLVTVPNSIVASSVVDNMGERKFRRFKLTLGIAYDTSPDRTQAFVEGVRAVLAANEAIVYDMTQVYLQGFGPSSMDVLVYAFLDVPDWSKELEHRHYLLLEFHRLAAALQVEFAFPTQTLHVGSLPGQPAPTAAASAPEELARIVRAFGPGGDMARPDGRPLTPSWGVSGRNERGEADAG